MRRGADPVLIKYGHETALYYWWLMDELYMVRCHLDWLGQRGALSEQDADALVYALGYLCFYLRLGKLGQFQRWWATATQEEIDARFGIMR